MDIKFKIAAAKQRKIKNKSLNHKCKCTENGCLKSKPEDKRIDNYLVEKGVVKGERGETETDKLESRLNDLYTLLQLSQNELGELLSQVRNLPGEEITINGNKLTLGNLYDMVREAYYATNDPLYYLERIFRRKKASI